MILNKKIYYIALYVIILSLSCTEEQPFVPEDLPGSIVGIVKPLGIDAQINLLQGKLLQSAKADSATGYFEILSITAGVYNLEIVANNYGRLILNQVIVYPNKATATPEIYLKPLPEQIIYINPADNTKNVPLTFPVEIEFSFQMNQSSVENNFTIQPSVSGYFEWNNSAVQNKMIFHPSDQYATNQSYTIKLNRNAKTIYGDTLFFSVESNFTTEDVKIVSTIPEDNATYISPQSEIFISFNSKMDRESVENKIVMSPSTKGDFRWLDSKKVSFKPSEFLASNTEYEVLILPGLKDVYDSFFMDGKSFIFKTEPLKVVSNYPANGATYISTSSPIVLTFNTYMNQAATENSFSISPNIEGWDFQWSDLTRFQFMGTSKLQANTQYTVTIDSSCLVSVCII